MQATTATPIKLTYTAPVQTDEGLITNIKINGQGSQWRLVKRPNGQYWIQHAEANWRQAEPGGWVLEAEPIWRSYGRDCPSGEAAIARTRTENQHTDKNIIFPDANFGILARRNFLAIVPLL